ncbi:MAG: ribosome maturation factor RimM [Cyanobacteria bacterium]|nr:ribosome maturation factor RimM [Cyanobacteriota bacterium]
MLKIGTVVGVHGLKGILKVRPSDPNAEWVGELAQLWLQVPSDKTPKPYIVLSSEWQSPLIWLKLQGIDSRTLAEPLMKASLFAPEEALPEISEGEYRFDQLLGMLVSSTEILKAENTPFAIVKDMLTSGDTDYLEVESLLIAGKTMLIPFQKIFIQAVHLPGTDYPKGLILIDKLDDLLLELKEIHDDAI